MDRAPAIEMQPLGRSLVENEFDEYEDGKVSRSAVEMQRIMVYIQRPNREIISAQEHKHEQQSRRHNFANNRTGYRPKEHLHSHLIQAIHPKNNIQLSYGSSQSQLQKTTFNNLHSRGQSN